MDRLKRIPSPPGHLVREFCHRTLPIVAFLAAVLGTAYLWNQRFAGSVVPFNAGRTDSPLRSECLDHPAGRGLVFVIPLPSEPTPPPGEPVNAIVRTTAQ